MADSAPNEGTAQYGSSMASKTGQDDYTGGAGVPPPVDPKAKDNLETEVLGMIDPSTEDVARAKKKHLSITAGAKLTFDYIWLLIIASVVAGLGLASNNTAAVIAAMLVSPIMGPVIGLSYGVVVRDKKLIWLAFRNECLSLLGCILIGVILGLCCGWTDLADTWVTDEMYSRGQLQGFLVGLPVAFFSGLGVALSVLDENTSSLVGVAISASLLPPAVDAGLLWLFAGTNKGKDWEANNPDEESLAVMGAISLALCVANILLVWLAAVIMFRMKEIVALKNKHRFFHKDLKTIRTILTEQTHRIAELEDEVKEELEHEDD